MPDTLSFGTEIDYGSIDEMMSQPQPEPEQATESYDRADASIIDKPERTPRAKKYEKKANKSIGTLTRLLLQRPATVPDAATLMLYGPDVAETFGDLADKNPRVAKIIEMFEESTDSPVLAVISATTPLLLQLIRNHEPVLEPKERTIKLGMFNVRIPRKIGVRLGLLRGITHDPDAILKNVFGDPDVVEALRRNGVTVPAPRGYE